jgi:hypothetical protein
MDLVNGGRRDFLKGLAGWRAVAAADLKPFQIPVAKARTKNVAIGERKRSVASAQGKTKIYPAVGRDMRELLEGTLRAKN